MLGWGGRPGEESLDAWRQEGRLAQGEAGGAGVLGSGSGLLTHGALLAPSRMSLWGHSLLLQVGAACPPGVEGGPERGNLGPPPAQVGEPEECY